MDILQLQEMANSMPTPALLEAVNSPNSPVPAFLALTVLNERKNMQAGANAQQAQQQLAQQPPTVAQGVTQGVAGLPTGTTIPQQGYAQGGIVAFDRGGMIPYSPGALRPPMYSQDEPVVPGPDHGRSILTKLPEMWEWLNKFTQRANVDYNYVNQGYGNEGQHGLPALTRPTHPGMNQADYSNEPSHLRSTSTSYPIGPARPSGVPSTAVGGGIGGGMRQQSGYPDFVDPRTGAAPRMTEEQRDAEVMRQYERIKAMYGEDVAQQFITEIKAERGKLDQRYTDNKNEAWLRAGLGMLAGRSKWGAVNIGEGGQQGLNAYQAGRAAIDRDGRDLRREEMAARMGMQQRQDVLRGQAQTQADRAADRTDRTRAEDIAVNTSMMEHKVKAAQFGLDSRKVDAMFAEVSARLAAVKESAAARGDERMLRVIDGAYNGAVKQVLEGIKDDPFALKDFNENPGKYADKIDRAFQQRMSATQGQMSRMQRGKASAFGLD